MRFRSSEAASATGGRLHGPDVWIEGASFDSRSLRPGSLFVPIVAAHDGHDHIADAFSAGAAASLTSRPVGSLGLPPGSTMIEVDDTAAALMALGGARAGRTGWWASPGPSARPPQRTCSQPRWRAPCAPLPARAASTTSRACRSPSSTAQTTPR